MLTILYFTNMASSDESSKQNICLLDKDPGLCRAAFISYYYDNTKQDCFKFIYGGCGGNANNFKTYEDCYKRCVLQNI